MGGGISESDLQRDQSFRDSISTADKDGNRIWLYPKNPSGKFTQLRTYLALLFLTMMVGGLFIKIDGEPLLMLNVLERKFIIFGKIFWPQDFHIFLMIMLAFMVFIVLFTVVYGRIFCGFVCPQTIFMESVFRKIEYWIEGDWHKRIALDKAPVSVEKFVKKLLKHLVYFSVSFLIANIFLSYILGVDKTLGIWSADWASELGTLTAILIFTSVFYYVYARFREQVCTTVCPYGRLQGVLLDKNSLVVAYDYVRGEPRAKYKKTEARLPGVKGDCIDCHQCVDVCPMGIDIRNGTQLECTNCTACIDSCNNVMDLIGRPRGLIRFDSENGISEKMKFRFTSRITAYTGVLVILIGFIFAMLITRSDIETTMLRSPGALYQEVEGNKISNVYNIEFINKTNKVKHIKLKLDSEVGELKLVGKDIVLPAQGRTESFAFIVVNEKDIKKLKTKFKVKVYADGELVETVSTNFMGPVQ